MRCAALMLALCTGLTAFAGENGKKAEKVTPVLRPDPKVTAILDSLGDCSSANLPPIKTMGEWNATSKLYRMEKTGPVGRDFCIKAVWAPERKRALFCGGNHGSPHRLNDAWEYDLPSNTWVMLFAPDPNKPRKNWHDWAKKIATVKDGVVMSKRGGPLDTWHTWWQVTYDPNMKALIWGNPKSVEDKVPDVLGMSEAEKAKLYEGHSFWLFYPEQKKWKPLKTEPPYPTHKIGGAQAMEYVPDLGGPVYYSANWFASGMWIYNLKTNSWKDLKANKGANLYHNKTTPRSEAVMAYDTKNKVLVAADAGKKGRNTYHYELARNEWIKVISEPADSTKAPRAHDARSPIGYDPVGEVIVVYDSKTPDHIWTHSVKEERKKWVKHKLTGPPGPTRRLIGYWDPARNAMVVDSRGKVWVCRYKKTAVKPETTKSGPAAPKKSASEETNGGSTPSTPSTSSGQASSGRAGSPRANVARKGPLAQLPSKPGPHVARIKAMKDNSWLELGAPRPDPKWGPARGRSWSAPMPYAPKLGGAFLFGNGPHGAMFKKDRYGDELYFYDAGAHAWICCYPGFDVNRQKDIKINKDGFETIDGVPTPIAPMVHTWVQVTYDTDRQRFMCMPAENKAYWGKRLPIRRAFLGENKRNRMNASPWMWNANSASWGRARTKNSHGAKLYCGLVYVPSLKKTWCYRKYGRATIVKFYDAAANDWTDARPKGPVPPASVEYTLCLDTKRNRIYTDSGVRKDSTTTLWFYDLATNTFIDPKPRGKPGEPPPWKNRGANSQMMHYDAAADAVVLFRHRDTDHPGVFVYDIKKNEWTTATKTLPKWPGRARSGFYHPEMNAHFIHGASDGRTNGKMYVYRYKKPAAGKPRPAAPKKATSAPPAPAPKKAPRTRKRTPEQVCTGWFSAARNYRRIGMLADARRCLQKITAGYPESEWALKARQELAKLGTP